MNDTAARSALYQATETNADREEFYERVSGNNLRPLWLTLPGLAKPEPQSAAQPVLWAYDEVRPLLFETVPLISVEEAERRVLSLFNPGMKPIPKATNSLMAGLQLLLPGEVAPAHRHSPSALRFVLEGTGAYTAVDGEKAVMSPGDFVITPSWTFHDHGNDTDQPTIWLDVLDVPIVALLDANFTEEHAERKQLVGRADGDSLARFGSGMLPIDYEPRAVTSPVFNYPYARTREALETMRRQDEWDSCHGLKLQFVNPVDGGPAMPAISTFMQLLPSGFRSTPYRSTDGAVVSPVEGRGRTIVTKPDGNEITLAWKARDIFVIPAWCWHRHEADEDAVLFSASDRAAQDKLGLWRQTRGNVSSH